MNMNFTKLILNDVSTVTGISLLKLKGKKRNDEIVTAKKIFVLLAKTFTADSFTTIGSYINKDHSMISHYLKNWKELYNSNFDFRKIYDKLYYNIAIKQKLYKEGLYRCSKCNSTNVISSAWIDINSNEVVQISEIGLKFCKTCNTNVSINKINIENVIFEKELVSILAL